ncbi:MAG TPA: multicopper oxidase domain-containing protein [Gemmatimonadaceae bacterium]|nr:multicopper oxidase domain-containing protein [Gemmatimonadaceae bacterium]
MLSSALHAVVWIVTPLLQDAIVKPLPRVPLPRPVANAPMVAINHNRVAAGTLANRTLTLALDIVEAAWRAEGPGDPVVRILALAERGKVPQVPGPLLRAEAGTTVRLTLRNRSDSAVMMGGFRQSLSATDDTLHLAAGATREITFKLDSVGTFFYWGVLKGLQNWRQRDWLDSQLTGAFVVDPPGTTPEKRRDRVWVVTEWFHSYPDRPFESVLVFNGKAWPHNDRLTLKQGDSVHWRFINAAAIEHPMHLHGFYFRVTHRGGERADTSIAPALQPLQNMQVMQQGGTMSISWVPTTPGNWVFHCHFASHVGDHVSLHGSPDPHLAHGEHDAAGAVGVKGGPAKGHDDKSGGHQMRGLVIGMHVTPARGYREPTVANRRTLRLLAQKRPLSLLGGQTAYGFVLQQGDSAPPRDAVQIPGPILELRRGEPVRMVVKNNMDEPTGVHWHGLEIESFPDGVPGFSGIGTRIMPPIAPADSFVAEFTPPRSGTFPYHSHLHELRQIGSGMYGAIIVSDAPRDTTHDHVVVAGGGGLPVFDKAGPSFLLVNGRMRPRPLRMTMGESHRIRIVSIHADNILRFRLGDDSTVASWKPIARDGADLPSALQAARTATVEMGPGETADFTYVPTKSGSMTLEVWMWPTGARVALPIIVSPRSNVAGR